MNIQPTIEAPCEHSRHDDDPGATDVNIQSTIQALCELTLFVSVDHRPLTDIITHASDFWLLLCCANQARPIPCVEGRHGILIGAIPAPLISGDGYVDRASAWLIHDDVRVAALLFFLLCCLFPFCELHSLFCRTLNLS